jgi:hypothetical protein
VGRSPHGWVDLALGVAPDYFVALGISLKNSSIKYYCRDIIFYGLQDRFYPAGSKD